MTVFQIKNQFESYYLAKNGVDTREEFLEDVISALSDAVLQKGKDVTLQDVKELLVNKYGYTEISNTGNHKVNSTPLIVAF